jgi:hypothetical protein
MTDRSPQEIKEFVRDRYGSRARERLEKLEGREKEEGAPVAESACCGPSAAESSCCGPSDATALTEPMVQLLYSAEELKDLPEEALSSLGWQPHRHRWPEGGRARPRPGQWRRSGLLPGRPEGRPDR